MCLGAGKSEIPEKLRVQQLDRLAGQDTAGRCHLGDRAAPVGGVRRALDQALLLQPVHEAGDARLVDLQLLAELAQRQRPVTEVQADQQLVPGEGEVDRREDLVGSLGQHLMDTHQRGHDGAADGAFLPAVLIPEMVCLEDRVPVAVRSHADLSMGH